MSLLNDALASELTCILRYMRHFFMAIFMAKGKNSDQVKVEFLIHASEEMIHADLLANRIVELGGAPNFSLDCLGIRSRTEYVERDTLKSMIKKDLIAERIAIENYT